MQTYLFLFVTAVGAVFIIYIFLIYKKTKVPIINIKRKYLKPLLSVLKIDADTVVYELRSGRGNFAFAIADKKPKRVIGYELSPLHVGFSGLKVLATASKAEFYRKDFF